MADKEKKEIAKLTTPVFRVSFPQLFEAKAYGKGDPKYSVSAIFPKDLKGKPLEQYNAMRKLAQKTAIERFGKAEVERLSRLHKFKWPLRDGEEKDLDGYGPEVMFCTLSTKMPPGVIGRGKERLEEKDVYAGCYARATITCYSFDNESKGVAFGLNNIQKVGEGAPFTQRTAAEDDFDEADDDVWVDDKTEGLDDDLDAPSGGGESSGDDDLDDLMG